MHFLATEKALKARKGTQGRMWGRELLYVDVAKHKEERQKEHAECSRHAGKPQVIRKVHIKIDLNWSLRAPWLQMVENPL